MVFQVVVAFYKKMILLRISCGEVVSAIILSLFMASPVDFFVDEHKLCLDGSCWQIFG
jgi:hypothetical protein